MKHTFEYHWESLYSELSDYHVKVETHAEGLDELLDIFKQYLQACGFAFKLNESIIVYDEDEE